MNRSFACVGFGKSSSASKRRVESRAGTQGNVAAHMQVTTCWTGKRLRSQVRSRWDLQRCLVSNSDEEHVMAFVARSLSRLLMSAVRITS